MFKIGDMAVYPAQGVGVIEAIESREYSGQKNDFYVLRIVDSDMTIMVPIGNVSQVGLRCLIEKGKVDTIYDILEEKRCAGQAFGSWSRRQREYQRSSRRLLLQPDGARRRSLVSDAGEQSHANARRLALYGLCGCIQD